MKNRRKLGICSISFMVTLGVLAGLLVSQDARALAAIAKRKTYVAGEVFTASDYNADRDETVTWVNALNAKFPGDSVKVTLVSLDTLVVNSLTTIIFKNAFSAKSREDSLITYSLRANRTNTDSLYIGGLPVVGFRMAATDGRRVRLSHARFDTAWIGTIPVTGPSFHLFMTNGNRANFSQIQTDSISVGSTVVVGFRMAVTDGSRAKFAYGRFDSAYVGNVGVVGFLLATTDGQRAKFSLARVDTLNIGSTAGVVGFFLSMTDGSRAKFSQTQFDSLSVGSTAVVGFRLVATDGARAKVGYIRADSAYVGNVGVVGFLLATTDGTRTKLSLARIDTLNIGSTAGVVGFLMSMTDGSRGKTSFLQTDTLAVGSTAVVGFRLTASDGSRARLSSLAADSVSVKDSLYVMGAFRAASDSASLDLQDSTLTASGKRILVGSLHDDQFNCVQATTRGDSYECGGSFERFRELEKSTSLHNSRNAAATADSGGLHPAEFAAVITTASDSLIIWDRLTGKMFAAVVKAANNACGNNNFNDVAFVDGEYHVATAGGNCIIDYLTDQILLYSTSGVGEYQGTFQQRNAARGTLTINTSPAIVNNTVNAVAAVRNPFGRRDGLNRLAVKWAAGTGGGGSIFDIYLNGIYDSSDAQTWLGMIFGSHGSFYGSTSDATRDDLQWYYSGFSKTADAFAVNDAWDNNSSGSEDLAWSSAAVIPTSKGVAVVSNASIAGTSADILALGSDEGFYLLYAKANDNTNGVKIRGTNEGIYPPEHGDCVLAWSGWESSDGSPYNNVLTNNGGPGYNTTGSSTIVFSGAYSSTSNSYLNRIGDSDFNLGNDAAFSISLYFKSQSATNPSAAENLLDMSDATDNDQVHIFFATDGTITARVTDDARVNYDSVDPATDYYDANWHHLELVFDTASFIARIDGETAATTTQNAVNTSIDLTEVWIGASYAAGSFFNGQMTQVTICKENDELAFSRWLYSRMLASLNIEGNGRRSPSLDVDYVQCYGTNCITGDEDSTVVWDGVLGLPVPKRRYGSPGGNIQDAALYQYGADSLAVGLVSTTRTQFIQPDARVLDLAQHRSPFVQPGGVLAQTADSSGAAGIFWTGNDLWAAIKNAHIGKAFVKAGTYPPTVLSQDSLLVECEGDKVVFDGTTTAHGFSITGDHNKIFFCGAKTTAGGGQAFDGFNISDVDNWLINCRVPSSDDDGITTTVERTTVEGCFILSADDAGIFFTGGSDSIIRGNYVQNQGGISLHLTLLGNTIYDNNRLDGAITDSGTGDTAGDNNTAGY